jgi:hypothetical protein
MKIGKLNENEDFSDKYLDDKYKKANIEYQRLINNPPDLKKSEPMEIYNWLKQLVDLTKIR